MDEKASDVAWSAWKCCAELTYRERLDVAITAYEQARERVAVPSVTKQEALDLFALLTDESGIVIDRWDVEPAARALSAWLAQRPAPTSERVSVPSREEIAAGLSTAYQGSELNADEGLEFDDIIAELLADEAHTRPTEPALEPVRLEEP